MPFTPLHLGFGILLAALLSFLDPFSIIVGSVAPDIEGAMVVFFFPFSGLPLHGFLHSFLGAFLLGMLTGLFSYGGLKFTKLANILQDHLSMNITLGKSAISGIIGTFSHIFLDVTLYTDMNPFFPLIGNPFYGIVNNTLPLFFCMLGFFVGVPLFLIMLTFRLKKSKSISK
ncbi:MAG: hypothetical protein ACFFDI_23290 [Promethearchaeota archaeon]